MRILSYEGHGPAKEDLHFSRIEFGKLNLVVGDSATGKTRLLNTIFNGASLVTQKGQFFIGFWDMTFEHKGKTFHWIIETDEDDEEESTIRKECIYIVEDNKETIIVDRNEEIFTFKGETLPKLDKKVSSVSILMDEEIIKPMYDGLQSILRRNFSGPQLDLSTSYETVPQGLLKKINKTKDLKHLFSSGLHLNGMLYVLSIHFKDIYEKICKEFKATFPFISEVELLDTEAFKFYSPGVTPVFAIKEKGMKKWISSQELSSGMKKVLLILTDLYSLPEDGKVYLIDEYENSLGINAINFFPSVLSDVDSPSQFIITSHHPYLIGKVPVKNWIVLHRKGSKVSVKQGKELEQRFGKSRQQAFVQLVNDPFYSEGVE